MKKKTLKIKDDEIGIRLDKFLSNTFPEYSRTLLQNLIEEEAILINNKKSKAGYKLRKDDEVTISIPELKKLNIEPEKIDLDIAYEDDDLIIINKPQGMITHPGSGVNSGTLVNALLFHCKKSLSGINGVLRPGIVHRLDKETSGLIIVCKNDISHREIARQLKEREIKKKYYAIVHGNIKTEKGTINKPIGRHKIQRHKMAIVLGGRNSVTHWRLLKVHKNFSFLECDLETGRTHQIRVHLASLNHPVVGDKTYGKKNDNYPLMLHAYKLIFKHPITKKEINLELEIPDRFKKILCSSS